MSNIKNNKSGLLAIKMLQNKGFEAGFVGGCVRDYIMGLEAKDFDITTSAMPNEIVDVFKEYKTLDIGIKHGTVVVIIDNEPIEITTYRIDGNYSDGRHPDSVTFTRNLINDLSRRDFTQNAIFYNDAQGLIDPFHGISDIKEKVIKTVGEPEKRFHEDGLRIMRCLRFASTLGFSIERNTKKAILDNINLLKNISIERITCEFVKLMGGNNACEILQEYKSVFAFFIPELKKTFDFNQHNPYHKYDVFTHIVESVKNSPNLKIKLVMLFHDIGKPQCFFEDEKNIGHFYGHADVSYTITKEIFKRLKISTSKNLSKKDIEDILLLIRLHDIQLNPTTKSIKKILLKLNGDTNLFLDLLKVKKADTLAKSDFKKEESLKIIDLCQDIFMDILNENLCLSIKDLKLTGNDIKDLGLKGKDIGIMLNLLLQNVIEEKLQNNKKDLISFAKRQL
ncbi:CCA tRNA nucleotidyltransferase [Clostridium sp. HCP1S3_B4]|uniref:CCA tRNA nucleotidyltransferase n=1 Tax=unclassified Clostridium TaxID=2614128 RepID=UPI0016B70BF9|nr:HD domain-containing protein [Clostridiales bacterium]MDY2728880.1 HD domain-containing protein [Clostridium sp.]NLK23772.1 HD domain-containing protein [Clostridiales bacterium]